MVGPYNIPQIDVGGALNALEAARSNRIRSMLLERQIRQDEQEQQRQSGVRAAYARYAGADTPTPSPAASALETTYGMGDGAPTADTGAIPSAAGAPTDVPMVPPAAAPTGALPEGPADEMTRRMGLFRDLMTIDAPTAIQTMQALSQMDDATFQAADRRRGVLARGAQYLLQLPPERRAAEWQRIAPQLIENGGMTRGQATEFELTDDNLRFVVMQARDLEKLAEEARPNLTVAPMGSEIIDENDVDPVTHRPRVVYQSPLIEVNGEVLTRPNAAPPAAAPQSEADLRAAAEDAIRRGADPAQVNARLEQMLRQGGAGQPGPQTFP